MKAHWVVLSVLAAASTGSATSLFYNLTCDSVSTCANPSFGQVELDQVDANTVKVTLTLAPGDFITDNGTHSAFTWSILNDPTLVTITNVSLITTTGSAVSPFTYPGGTGNPPFTNGGTFDYGITESNSNSHCCSDLSFTITIPTGLSVNDFVANSAGFYFATDIYANGATFAVASNAPCPDCGGGTTQDLPEPFSMALVGSGLALVGLRQWWRRA